MKYKYNPYRKPPILRAKPPSGYIREVVPRETWGALQPSETTPMEPTTLPVENVILTYYTKTDNCEDSESCQKTLKSIQLAHMTRGMPDIAYNFLVGGDMKIYEGRGWFWKPQKHEIFSDIYNNSIEIAFIGDYREIEYPDMSKLMVECFHAIDIGVTAKNVCEFFRIKETTPKLRVETMCEDERPWVEIKKTEFSTDPEAYQNSPYPDWNRE